jgi:hypothetical protein
VDVDPRRAGLPVFQQPVSSGTGNVKHELEISYDGETWTSTATSITLSTAPSYLASTPLAGCAAAAVRIRSTATTAAVFYTCGLSISRN